LSIRSVRFVLLRRLDDDAASAMAANQVLSGEQRSVDAIVPQGWSHGVATSGAPARRP